MTRQNIWNLRVPIDEGMLMRSGPPPTHVQFPLGVPTQRDHQILGAFLASHPTTTVRLFGADLTPDMEWLQYYSAASRVYIDVNGVSSFEPLRALRPDLEELTLGDCGARRVSLAPLAHFTALRSLGLVRHQKDIAVLGQLQSLERLTLISMKLPSLDDLRTLTHLWWFTLGLGGTTNLDALPHIGHLQYLEIWRVNGLSDLSVVSELGELEYLLLQHLKRVNRLPVLSSCGRLRRVHLDRVGIDDLESVATAPHLEELLLLDMPQLREEAFRVLLGHPTLRFVTAGVRNEKRRANIRAMLGLEDVPNFGTDFRFTSGRHALPW